MSCIGAIRTILFAIGAVSAAAPAAAHSPYFTQTEKLALPDGRIGEIRLLHGDGIFFSDPVRAIVIDEQGRPLARSSWSGAMIIACDGANRCRVYDLERWKRHDPDPAAFRVEAVFDRENEDFWPVPGREGYGFAVRRMTPADFVRGHAAYVAQNRLFSAVAFAVGAFAITLFLVGRRSAPRKTAFGTMLHYFFVAFGAVLIAPLLLLVSLFALLFDGMPLLVWVLCLAMGAVASGIGFWWLTQRTKPQHAM